MGYLDIGILMDKADENTVEICWRRNIASSETIFILMMNNGLMGLRIETEAIS